MEKIKILHTNDLHSHFENWPKIRRYLLAEKKDANSEVLTFDLGDFIDRFHPLTEATQGKANIDLMNEIHYDAVTIGNNEGVGSAKDDLNHLYDNANFDVILGNLKEPSTHKIPNWAKPYKIFSTSAGTKIAVIALTAYFPLTYQPNGWDIETVDAVLPDLIAKVYKQADLVILLSHLGINEDRRIAKKYSQIGIIIGSHTHHLLKNGEIIDGTLIAAAGKFGRYIGKIELLLKNKQIIDYKIATIETAELPLYAGDEEEVFELLKRGHHLLAAQKVGYLSETLVNACADNYPIVQFALEAIKSFAEVDIAVLNSGLFLGNLSSGEVNMDQLHQILPHPMHIIKVTLSGLEMKRLILEMEKNRSFLSHFPIIGMGFRGKIFGQIVYSNICFEKTTKEVKVLGKTIDDKEMYTLATVDHFLFVPFFPTIEIKGKIEFLFPEFIRQVVAKYISLNL